MITGSTLACWKPFMFVAQLFNRRSVLVGFTVFLVFQVFFCFLLCFFQTMAEVAAAVVVKEKKKGGLFRQILISVLLFERKLLCNNRTGAVR